MQSTKREEFKELSDPELIELIFRSGDDLPREAMDEIIGRGSRMIPYLYVIVSDKTSWTRELPQWWAVVHATYALGAYETTDALNALLAALRWSDAFDCDWVIEDLPSIFGRLGKDAFGPLALVLRDVSAGWGARAIALSSMAACTITAPFLKDSFLDLAARIVGDATEPVQLRQTAANILLDFRSQHHRPLLIKFGKEESARQEEIPDYVGAFYHWEVDEFLNLEESEFDMEFYQRDWLCFYDPEERERRLEHWAEEQSKLNPRPSLDNEEDFASTPCPCGSGLYYSECCMKKLH